MTSLYMRRCPKKTSLFTPAFFLLLFFNALKWHNISCSSSSNVGIFLYLSVSFYNKLNICVEFWAIGLKMCPPGSYLQNKRTNGTTAGKDQTWSLRDNIWWKDEHPKLPQCPRANCRVTFTF